jgi:release factor glutamine methyltransferase
MTTIDRILAEARVALAQAAGTQSLDAELLLAHVLAVPRFALRHRDDRSLDPAEADRYRALLARRAAGEPVAYLTGRWGFWTLDLAVSPAVLVPRPETELLVEIALGELQGRDEPAVLDLGTGSGAIALAIATELPAARVTAVDSSTAALEVARDNAAAAGAGRVEFRHGHWYGPVAGRRFDAILANPPYLAEADPHLPALAHEPSGALVSGPTGFEALAEIVAGAASHLLPGGLLAVEHGCEQGAAVRTLCLRAGLEAAETRSDLAGLERATLARRAAAASPDG